MFSETFRIYETLNKYFQDENDARALASEIETMIHQRWQSEKEQLATKMDIMELKSDISQLKLRMKHAFRQQLRLNAWMMAIFAAILIVTWVVLR